mmetsp:Transcript_110305/g.292966  ORF Transcript_110305/g.292966 Transcript_110305/m.292966 type:complete len:257 (-) Transcript_110305:10-780(-)
MEALPGRRCVCSELLLLRCPRADAGCSGRTQSGRTPQDLSEAPRFVGLANSATRSRSTGRPALASLKAITTRSPGVGECARGNLGAVSLESIASTSSAARLARSSSLLCWARSSPGDVLLPRNLLGCASREQSSSTWFFGSVLLGCALELWDVPGSPAPTGGSPVAPRWRGAASSSWRLRSYGRCRQRMYVSRTSCSPKDRGTYATSALPTLDSAMACSRDVVSCVSIPPSLNSPRPCWLRSAATFEAETMVLWLQ